MSLRVFSARFEGQEVIALPCSDHEWRLVKPSIIKDLYRQSANIRVFAAALKISTQAARKVLKLTKIDYLYELYGLYRRGVSCSKIASKNGMKRGTLSALFKQRGWPVAVGRSRRRVSQYQLMLEAMHRATINGVARSLRMHWATAKSLLCQQNLMTLKNGRFCPSVEVNAVWYADLQLRL